MSSIIRFEQVSVKVHDKPILSDVSFALSPGSKAVLRGASGAGKSSVLKALMGLLPISAGRIFFQESLLSVATVKQIRSHAAYIGQEPVLGADNVREALLLPFQYQAHKHQLPSERRIREVLEKLRLPCGILRQSCLRISGGEKQRLALARGLLLDKSVYLLDEITSALDPESKRAVLEVFADSDLTILSVAHDPDWDACCDSVLQMAAGRLL